MHINPWAKGQSNAVGRGWHSGHRDHPRDAAKSLQQQATQDVVAALRKRLVSDTSAAQADGSATDAPMQTLVATVQSAISLRAASGADPVPDVLGAVRSALSDARAALVKAGASDEDAEKAVSSVSQQLGAALNAAPATNAAAATSAATPPAATTTPGSSESTLSVSAAASNYVLTYVRKQKASLDILTQEGDRIQIRFRAKEAVTATGSTVSNTTAASSSTGGASGTAAAAASSTTGSTPAANATTANATAANTAAGSSATTTTTAAPGSSIHAFASGRIEVSVQGQLSADELKAIGDLAGKVDALANEFFQGDLQQAFTAAASLGFDSTQIAGFALKLSQQESVRQSGALPAAKPAAAPASSASPAVAAPAKTTPVATPVAAPAADPAPVATPASAIALDGTSSASTLPATDAASNASSTSPAPASADAQAATLQDTLSGFVRKVLDTMATPNSSGRLEFSMRWKLSLVVAAVEAGAPKSAQGSDAGTSLLTRSIKDVAAQAPISLAPANLAPASA